MSTGFRITPAGEFSLAKSVGFLRDFTPAGYLANGDRPDADDVMRLAFPVEGEEGTVGVTVRQSSSGVVTADVVGVAAGPAVRAQIARILSLDVDGSGLAAAVSGDEHARDLVEKYRGLRPVCFYSPYEAACWAVLSNRIRRTQAATLKTRLAESLGTTLTVDGVPVAAFPAPSVLAGTDDLPGLPEVKVQRLRAVARAALDGELDGALLRELEPDEAIDRLRRIDGIGPFGAELILVRGAGAPDRFPRNEPRLHKEMSATYGVSDQDVNQLARIAEGWSPFRSWVSFYFRVQAED